MRPDINWNRPLAVQFIRDYVEQAGADGVVLGVSGGIDSAVCLSLAVEALGEDSVVAVWMPHGEQDVTYTNLVMKKYPNVSRQTRQINAVVNAAIAISGATDDLRRGNFMSRTRMMILYDIAKSLKYLVISTSNRSEIMSGYFTKWGDGAGDLAPIANLYKYEVINIAKELGIPDEIIQRAPSAELWEGQTDEAELGISYKELDDILGAFNRIARTKFVLEVYGMQIQLEAEYGIKKINHVVNLISNSFHKRQQIPNPRTWSKSR